MLAAVQPFDPAGIALTAAFNPVVLLVAAWLGWHADQWQKTIVAGFAAALAGAVAIWLATAAGVFTVRGYGGVSGVFAVSFIWGTVVAAIARFIRLSRG